MSGPVRPAYARYVLGLLVAVYVMNFIDRQIVAILLDPIKQDLGVSDTAMGLPLPGAGAALACFAPFYLLSNMHVGPVWSALQGIARLRMRATVSALFQFVLNLIGLGLGPFVVGMLNDELTERHGAEAIRWSLCIVTAVGAVGALFLFGASRALPRDLARRDV